MGIALPADEGWLCFALPSEEVWLGFALPADEGWLCFALPSEEVWLGIALPTVATSKAEGSLRTLNVCLSDAREFTCMPRGSSDSDDSRLAITL